MKQQQRPSPIDQTDMQTTNSWDEMDCGVSLDSNGKSVISHATKLTCSKQELTRRCAHKLEYAAYLVKQREARAAAVAARKHSPDTDLVNVGFERGLQQCEPQLQLPVSLQRDKLFLHNPAQVYNSSAASNR
jgi:hypothetical protein